MYQDTTYLQVLTTAGFSENEARAYVHLVKRGAQPASQLARHLGIQRTLMYVVLRELEKKGLVERRDPKGAISTFVPSHPLRLQEIVNQQKRDVEKASTMVDGVLSSIVSDYNNVFGRPGVAFYEGAEGVKSIYEDTIETNKSGVVHVLRSHLDDVTLGHEFYMKYAKLRARNNIRTEIITPKPVDHPSAWNDAELLRERRYMKELEIPTEIDIYDDKVAFIAFEEPIIGTIIEKKAVADTMRTIFKYMWDRLEDKK